MPPKLHHQKTERSQLLASIHHDELEDGSAKSKVAKILDSKWCEAFILLLVFIDIGLLTVEAGIDHHILCIDGEVVPRPHPMSFASLLPRQPLAVQVPETSDMKPFAGLFLAGGNQSLPRTAAGGRTPGTIRPSGQSRHAGLLAVGQRNEPEHGHGATHGGGGSHDGGSGKHDRFVVIGSREALPITKHEKTAGGGYISNHHEAGHGAEHASGHEAGHGGHGGHGAHGHHSNEVLMCDTRDGHHAHHLAHNCHTASIVILCIFLIEISLKFWVNPSGFLHNWFLILDFWIIFLSLLTDTLVMWWVQTYKPERKRDLAYVAAALLFVRCWRIVRVVHGLAEHAHHYHESEEKKEELTERNEQLCEELLEARDKIQAYKQLCNENKVDYSKLKSPPGSDGGH